MLTCPKCADAPGGHEGNAASWKNMLRAVCKWQKCVTKISYVGTFWRLGIIFADRYILYGIQLFYYFYLLKQYEIAKKWIGFLIIIHQYLCFGHLEGRTNVYF